jgi:hypothetical protein
MVVDLYKKSGSGFQYELDLNINFIYLHPFEMKAKEEEARSNEDEFHGGFFTLRDLVKFLEFHKMELKDLRGWTPPRKEV